MSLFTRLFGKKRKELNDDECTEVLRYFIKIQSLSAEGSKLIRELSELTGIPQGALVAEQFMQISSAHNEIVRKIYFARHQAQQLVSELSDLTDISPEELVDSDFNILKKYIVQSIKSAQQ